MKSRVGYFQPLAELPAFPVAGLNTEGLTGP